MFKLVPDQLKIAQGWVRCGRCSEVFDASLPLISGQTAEAGTLAPTPSEMKAQSPAVPPDDVTETSLNALEDARSLTAQPYDPVEDSPAHEVISAQQGGSETRGLSEPELTRDADGLAPDSPLALNALEFPAQAKSETLPEVSFVRNAQRRAFWKMPLIRILLGLAFMALLTALAVQWIIRQKDVLAAQEPRLASLLQGLCRPLGCEVRPLRRIESLAIDSSSFSKTGPDAYRLTFVLKNTGAAALEMPALEVTLTDSQANALVRRVLLPAQVGITASTLGAHSEVAGAVSLTTPGNHTPEAVPSTSVGSLAVTGYRVVAFYP